MIPRIAALALALTLLSGCATISTPSPNARGIPVGDAARTGPPDSPIQVTVFIDFANRLMETAFTTVGALQERTPEPLFVVYKHRPRLRGSREVALHRQSAIAAIAATRQGKFRSFLSHLRGQIKPGSIPPSDVLLKSASEAGLNMVRFNRDLSDPLIPVQLNADEAVAIDWSVGQAPQILLNGRSIPTNPDAAGAALAREWGLVTMLRESGVPSAHISPLLSQLHRSAPPASARNSKPRPKPQDPTIHPVHWSEAHLALGASEKDTLVTLVVFVDYQCPFCLRHETTLEALRKEHPGDLRVVYRHHPLPMHKNAHHASAAALAAQELGQGAAYHARLTETARPVVGRGADPMDTLEKIASDLGLDIPLFRAAMKRHAPRVQNDRDESRKRFGVSGTPFTFINGKAIRGAVEISILNETIQEELKRARVIAKRQGLSGRALYRVLVGSR
jgi:predicted DsbA family dithiol-disulfide isomerase